ncbi:UDP-3-O-(3-hydroxymyristoyl)glucosamine N-acyltransferase [Acidobacteria bacterium AB60]|nr:UDP-3-O-(3-hydroxymyristoyl)glucosamine N-acyltransferase [Acidobacteria bacterium AB60]
MKIGELIERLGGTMVQGSPDHRVRGVAAAGSAAPGDLVFAEDPRSASEALASAARILIVRPGLIQAYPQQKCVVESPQPRLWFARAAKLLKPSQPGSGVHPSAVIGKDVEIGAEVSIGPCAVIEDNARIGARTRIGAGAVVGRGVRVGEYCQIHPRSVLYPGTTIGNWVVVHAGSVLGADGFGYVRNPTTGAYTQFPQQGTLAIEDEVEIGANTTIDRGALGETRIRRGTKIDNLVHVGHNCDIGEDVILVALTGISGSSSVGKGAVIAGQVGIGDHAHVGPGVILGGQAGVLSGKTVTNEGLKPGTVLWGTPARPLKQVLREQAVLTRLTRSRGGDKTAGPNE